MVKNDRKVQSSALKVPLRLKQSLYWQISKGSAATVLFHRAQHCSPPAVSGRKSHIHHSHWPLSAQKRRFSWIYTIVHWRFWSSSGGDFGPDTAKLTISRGISAKTFIKQDFCRAATNNYFGHRLMGHKFHNIWTGPFLIWKHCFQSSVGWLYLLEATLTRIMTWHLEIMLGLWKWER